MSGVRSSPSIGWRAAIIGAAIGVSVAELAGVGVASVIAIFVGGYIAASLAGHHGLLQGGAAAGVFIAVVGLIDTFRPVPELPPDTVSLIAVDAAHLLAGAAGGWLAIRS